MIIHNSFNSKNPKEPCPVQSMQNFHEKKQYVAGKFTDGEMRSLPFRMEMIIVGGVSNQDTRRANHFPSFQDVCRVKDPVKGVAQTIQVTALSVPLVDRSLDDRVRACLHSCVCMCMCPYRARAPELTEPPLGQLILLSLLLTITVLRRIISMNDLTRPLSLSRSAGEDTAAVKKLQPSKYEDAKP
jgi:hypothetical protein